MDVPAVERPAAGFLAMPDDHLERQDQQVNGSVAQAFLILRSHESLHLRFADVRTISESGQEVPAEEIGVGRVGGQFDILSFLRLPLFGDVFESGCFHKAISGF